MTETRDIVIIGGGIAGLTAAILLKKANFDVLLIEKKRYPFHRVCGEYISNEVIPFLIREELYPDELSPEKVTEFQLTAVDGSAHRIKLPLGGFGVSRFALDHFLFRKATALGVEVKQDTSVQKIEKTDKILQLRLSDGGSIQSQLVVGAYGKRSNLDNVLRRKFFKSRSPYLAVKYHLKTDHPRNLISLHNFQGGYCGISAVENDTYNLCYMSHRSNLRDITLNEMEQDVLFKNPFLKILFENSDFVFEKPLIINEISFSPKPLTENGVIMCGDAAGMITPLCGNGMAMAFHSAKILSDVIIAHRQVSGFDFDAIVKSYHTMWQKTFSTRLSVGRLVQRLFGGNLTSAIAVRLLKTSLGTPLVKMTHGSRF